MGSYLRKIARRLKDGLAQFRKSGDEPLFRGLEHVGLYPADPAGAAPLAEWYASVFGFRLAEDSLSYFASGPGSGRVEIMKAAPGAACHVAIHVSDFDAAVEALRARGIEVEAPRALPGLKAAYLKEPDPAGNRVHLIWIA